MKQSLKCSNLTYMIAAVGDYDFRSIYVTIIKVLLTEPVPEV